MAKDRFQRQRIMQAKFLDHRKLRIMRIVAEMRVMRQVIILVLPETAREHRRTQLADPDIVGPMLREARMTALMHDVVEPAHPRSDEKRRQDHQNHRSDA